MFPFCRCLGSIPFPPDNIQAQTPESFQGDQNTTDYPASCATEQCVPCRNTYRLPHHRPHPHRTRPYLVDEEDFGPHIYAHTGHGPDSSIHTCEGVRTHHQSRQGELDPPIAPPSQWAQGQEIRAWRNMAAALEWAWFLSILDCVALPMAIGRPRSQSAENPYSRRLTQSSANHWA